jgi:hypothetical protein
MLHSAARALQCMRKCYACASASTPMHAQVLVYQHTYAKDGTHTHECTQTYTHKHKHHIHTPGLHKYPALCMLVHLYKVCPQRRMRPQPVCTWPGAFACMHGCVHVHVYACVLLCVCAFMRVCMRVCFYACVHVCVSACMRAYVRVYALVEQ